jgi:hypothetical protein
MQTNAEELREGLPRKTREELPNNYKYFTATPHNAYNLTGMQGLFCGCRTDMALGVFGSMSKAEPLLCPANSD